MYSNGEGLGTPSDKSLKRKAWEKWGEGDESFTGKKRFVRCICPRCRKIIHVYMLWSGRGIPRKYCNDCKAIIDAYDKSATCESHNTALTSRKRRRQIGSEE